MLLKSQLPTSSLSLSGERNGADQPLLVQSWLEQSTPITITRSVFVSAQFFKDHPGETARTILEGYRWPNGQAKCPLCGGWRLYREKRKGQLGYYRCPASHEADASRPLGGQFVFSVRQGTILENSRLSLSKWLYCLAHIDRSRGSRGTSVKRLASEIGATRKTAARQLELIIMLDDYFWEKNDRYVGKLAVLQPVIDAFYKQPDQNQFLFQYRLDKAKERSLAYRAEREAKEAEKARSKFPLFRC
ncbi:transposase [Allopusillimonas ginsengisoli]|nr:transposase [Allopusillimonas ginsengisoli]